MKKKIVSFVLAVAMIVGTTFSAFAIEPGVIELKDLKRLQETVSNVRQKHAKIINYEKFNNGEWMVKLEVKDDEGKSDRSAGDFRVKFSSTPPAEGENLGKCWYWFGLYENKKVRGYAIAVREYQGMLNQEYDYHQEDSWEIPEFQK